jgi:hypothetical protein
MPSGVPESEYIDMASDRFQGMEGRAFRFKGCVEVLHTTARFSPTAQRQVAIAARAGSVVETEQDSSGTRNVVGTVMGSNLPRPTGCKAAKAAIVKKRHESAAVLQVRGMANKIDTLLERLDTSVFDKGRETVSLY